MRNERGKMTVNADRMAEVLSEGCRELGVLLPDGASSRFGAYMALLLEWNEKMNLTSITEPEEVAKLHFLDSLSCLVLGSVFGTGVRIADVGTGAGFPALPVKIVRPDVDVTLVDSVGKRLSFLEVACRDLGLMDCCFVHGRAEDVGRDPLYRDVYDVAVSRAVARLSVLCEYCLPVVKIGGHFVAMKGPSVDEELKDGIRAARLLGAEIVEDRHLELPFGAGSRRLIVFRKLIRTPRLYPRKAGTPAKSPL